MSFAGFQQFNENLNKLMDSEIFEKANDGERLKLGVTLLRSDFGLGRFSGFGKVRKLKTVKRS